jgi:hypothetical protein
VTGVGAQVLDALRENGYEVLDRDRLRFFIACALVDAYHRSSLTYDAHAIADAVIERALRAEP